MSQPPSPSIRPPPSIRPASATRRRRVAVPLVALTCLASCTVGPDWVRPDDPAIRAYIEAQTIPTAAGDAVALQRFALGEKIREDWWELFHAPRLSETLQQAIAGNLTVAAARANLAQARELVAQAGGARWPQIGLNSNATRSGSNYASSGFDQTGRTGNLYTIGPSATYALDLFGGIERQIERQGAVADLQAEQLNAAYLTLTGSVVQQAVQIAGIRAQIKANEQIIAVDQKNFDSVTTLLDVHAATRIELASAESQLATDRTLLPPLHQQLSVARHALAVLVGKAPAEWTPPDFELEDFALPDVLPVSLPSALVHQRPDILAAEAQVHSASAGIGVATAQLYPNITLSAGLAQQALMAANLMSSVGTIWNIAGNLTAPLFNGGSLRAQKRGAEDTYDGALLTYRQTVLQAFGQVADALDALQHDAELLEYEERALTATQASVLLTRTSFAAGQARFIEVLDAERLYQRALLGHARAAAQRFVDTSQLFVTMGGGRNWAATVDAKPAAVIAAGAAEPVEKKLD
jgi:NodT family efflux transporter outer membrane factor (OMF) lipoprotein